MKMEQLGANIRQLRRLKDYKQEYVAEKIGISTVAYGRIERGETDISISRLDEIAAALEVDVSTIVGFNEKQVFNLYQNQNAYGYINSQHVGTVEQTTMVETLKELMQLIKTINQELEKRKQQN